MEAKRDGGFYSAVIKMIKSTGLAYPLISDLQNSYELFREKNPLDSNYFNNHFDHYWKRAIEQHQEIVEDQDREQIYQSVKKYLDLDNLNGKLDLIKEKEEDIKLHLKTDSSLD